MQWLLGVVGVVLLGVLVDVLLPKGQMSKYVKGIFAVLLLFVMVTPIVNFFRHNTSIDDLIDFDAGSYEIDDTYIDLIDEGHRQAALDDIRRRYQAVYALEYADKEDGIVHVYVKGTAPNGLTEYVCIILSTEPDKVVIHESG